MLDGQRLRRLRENKELTQRKLGMILGVTNGTVSSWERGSRDPDTAVLRKMAELFHVSTDYLVGLTDDPFAYNKSLPFEALPFDEKVRSIAKDMAMSPKALEEFLRGLLAFREQTAAKEK